ncbi:MAG: hypothetical protein RL698_2098 [Pseudomonadota bacterium]
MLVLGIETSTVLGSVGVVEAPGEALAGENPRVLTEVSRDSGLQHGASLLGLIDEALDRAGVDFDGLGAVAVAIGPGSFTGLRVALATGKGLVLGTRTRLVGVPTLHALAEAALSRLAAAGPGATPVLLCPCLDARRGEVYGACFAVGQASEASLVSEGRLRETVPPGAWRPEEFADVVLAQAREGGSRVFVFGDGAQRHDALLRASLGDRAEILGRALGAPSGAAVALIGARGGGSPGDAAGLAPVYVRASEAERKRAADAAG